MWARKIKGTTCSVFYSAWHVYFKTNSIFNPTLCLVDFDQPDLFFSTCPHCRHNWQKWNDISWWGLFNTFPITFCFVETLPLWPGILPRVNTSAICFVAMVVFQVVQSLMPCTTCAVRFLKKRKRLRRVTGRCQCKNHGQTLSTPLHLHQQEVLTLWLTFYWIELAESGWIEILMSLALVPF